MSLNSISVTGALGLPSVRPFSGMPARSGGGPPGSVVAVVVVSVFESPPDEATMMTTATSAPTRRAPPSWMIRRRWLLMPPLWLPGWPGRSQAGRVARHEAADAARRRPPAGAGAGPLHGVEPQAGDDHERVPGVGVDRHPV